MSKRGDVRKRRRSGEDGVVREKEKAWQLSQLVERASGTQLHNLTPLFSEFL